MKEFFLIAKISSLFGHSGSVKVELYSDYQERFSETDKVFIDFWGGKKILFLESVKYAGNSVVVKFKNFDNERDAGVLIGRKLFIEKKDIVKLQENSFFIHDLIGSKVFQHGEGIGEIIDIIKLPSANDVIVIKREDEDDLLIPLVLEYIEYFDPEKKRLVLKKELDYDDED